MNIGRGIVERVTARMIRQFRSVARAHPTGTHSEAVPRGGRKRGIRLDKHLSQIIRVHGERIGQALVLGPVSLDAALNAQAQAAPVFRWHANHTMIFCRSHPCSRRSWRHFEIAADHDRPFNTLRPRHRETNPATPMQIERLGRKPGRMAIARAFIKRFVRSIAIARRQTSFV
jgi:hypothetical protein